MKQSMEEKNILIPVKTADFQMGTMYCAQVFKEFRALDTAMYTQKPIKHLVLG
jgi:hypothetical protein